MYCILSSRVIRKNLFNDETLMQPSSLIPGIEVVFAKHNQFIKGCSFVISKVDHRVKFAKKRFLLHS